MRNERKKQVMTLSILLVVVLVISIGFAAFSTTLRINTDITVNPNASDFKIVFSSSENTLETNAVKASPENMGSDATIDNTIVPTISGLMAYLEAPGDSVTYTLYVRNEGQYEAFLNSITFRGRNCTAEEGTNVALVNNACNSIKTTVNVGSVTTNETKTNITGESLRPGESKQVTVTISYDSNGAIADGPFKVQFGDISMYYATTTRMNEEVKVCQLSNDVNTKNVIDLGDEVTCGTESFYVMSKTDTEITMLAAYNLTLSETNPLQDPTDTTTPAKNPIRFTSQPWKTTETTHDYVYDSDSIVYTYVEAYRSVLEGMKVEVIDTKLMSYEQAISLGCPSSSGSCTSAPSWLYSTSYWLGSASDRNVWSINSSGSFDTVDYESNNTFGIRPVIKILASNI